jgi:hypothetical protein
VAYRLRSRLHGSPVAEPGMKDHCRTRPRRLIHGRLETRLVLPDRLISAPAELRHRSRPTARTRGVNRRGRAPRTGMLLIRSPENLDHHARLTRQAGGHLAAHRRYSRITRRNPRHVTHRSTSFGHSSLAACTHSCAYAAVYAHRRQDRGYHVTCAPARLASRAPRSTAISVRSGMPSQTQAIPRPCRSVSSSRDGSVSKASAPTRLVLTFVSALTLRSPGLE